MNTKGKMLAGFLVVGMLVSSVGSAFASGSWRDVVSRDNGSGGSYSGQNPQEHKGNGPGRDQGDRPGSGRPDRRDDGDRGSRRNDQAYNHGNDGRYGRDHDRDRDGSYYRDRDRDHYRRVYYIDRRDCDSRRPDRVIYRPVVRHGGSGRGFFGTLAGGAVGWTVGRHFGGRGDHAGLAIIGGTIIGAIIGHEIAESIDRNDERRANEALEANRTGESATWVNPDNNSRVSVTPTRTYETSSQEYCREYTTEVNVGGRVQSAYGTACRQPDGSWQIVQ